MSVNELFKPARGYKPFRFPWAYDMWLRQQQMHWLPTEVPMGEDVRDWSGKLNERERELLTQVFRFFTQADIDINDNYMEHYLQVFKPVEVKMMLSAFSNTETIHIAAYSLLVETVGMPESEYAAFLAYDAMRQKHDYFSQFGSVDHPRELLRTLAAFGAFGEGLQLFASFAMLLNFPRRGLMRGMGQIVAWSARDETLHCEGVIRLFHELTRTEPLTNDLKEELIAIAEEMVALEDCFIDHAYRLGPVEGLAPEEVKAYIRFIADRRLRQLGLPALFGYPNHPLPWMLTILNGIEHANFFEIGATEYSKGASVGSWGDVWGNFDSDMAELS